MIGHFKTVAKHKMQVTKACFACGLYWQGIMHDMSKFSPAEFFTSARYYQGGKSSPVFEERKDKLYSTIELHHHGHNPHHWEYWINTNFKGTPIKMPVEYVREMVCDHIGAGKIYKKDEWTPSMPYEHTKSALDRNVWLLHPATAELLLTLEKDFMSLGYEAIKKARVESVAKRLHYNEAIANDYYGKNVADLDLDLRGENRSKEQQKEQHVGKEMQPKTTQPKQKIGILGGTFNPITNGHLIIADKAKNTLGLDKIIFIPSGVAPWKTNIASADDRVAMARLATQDTPDFEVSTIETSRAGASYTIDTINQLKQDYPNANLHYICGADSFKDILKYIDGEKLAQTTNFVVFQRPGTDNNDIYKQIIDMQDKYNTKVVTLPGVSNDISSTMVRKGDLTLVPKSVAEYINNKGLYNNGDTQVKDMLNKSGERFNHGK